MSKNAYLNLNSSEKPVWQLIVKLKMWLKKNEEENDDNKR